MANGLPTGVVTLLFTDVEGSTRLLHELGDDYGEALHEHRRRLRAAFAEHEGVEVDTQGDATEQERAAAILTFALGHEQLPASYAFAARPALTRLESELPPEQLVAAREAAAAGTLEDFERTARHQFV